MTGLMHATSLGTSQRDYARALLYMSFAAVGGDTVATQVLGYWHLNGVGVEKDCSHAAFYYGRVAQTGELRFGVM